MEARYVITLTDPRKQEFWEQLLSSLDFVEVEGPAKSKALKLSKKEQKFMDELIASVQEMKDDLSGKKKLPSLKEALDELRG